MTDRTKEISTTSNAGAMDNFTLQDMIDAVKLLPDPKTIVAKIEVSPLGKQLFILACKAQSPVCLSFDHRCMYGAFFGAPIIEKNDLPFGVIMRTLNADGDVIDEVKA